MLRSPCSARSVGNPRTFFEMPTSISVRSSPVRLETVVTWTFVPFGSLALRGRTTTPFLTVPLKLTGKRYCEIGRKCKGVLVGFRTCPSVGTFASFRPLRPNLTTPPSNPSKRVGEAKYCTVSVNAKWDVHGRSAGTCSHCSVSSGMILSVFYRYDSAAHDSSSGNGGG